jgi:hypothetical protein
LGLQRQSIQKQSTLFEALDPAILEASQQALNLLQGKEAKSLDPLRRQFAQDETKLLNQLRRDMGPGAETSTAGIQALAKLRFDQNQQLQGSQQQSLSQLFGMGQSGAVNRGQLGGQIGQLANIGQGFGNAAGRRVGAITGTSPFIASAGQQVAQTAGSASTAESLRGNFGRNLLGSAVQGGTSAFIGGA